MHDPTMIKHPNIVVTVTVDAMLSSIAILAKILKDRMTIRTRTNLTRRRMRKAGTTGIEDARSTRPQVNM